MAISGSARQSIERRLAYLESVRDHVVIDGDTHPSDPDGFPDTVRARVEATPNYYHGRPITGEELIRDLDQAGVDMALCWQNPAVTPYDDDRDGNFAALLAANQYIHQLGEQRADRIIPAGWTDPKALGLSNALKLAEICVESFGFPIVKMNPAQNGYPITSQDVLQVVDRIVALGAVPAFHYGGDSPYTPAHGLRLVAERHPDREVIGVHMGGGGSAFVEGEALYLASRELGLDCENIFFIFSAKRDTHIESDLITYRLAGGTAERRLACASDAPYGRPSWNFGGFRQMFRALQDGANHNDRRLRERPDLFDDDAVQNFMGRNLADLIIGIDQRLLSL